MSKRSLTSPRPPPEGGAALAAGRARGAGVELGAPHDACIVPRGNIWRNSRWLLQQMAVPALDPKNSRKAANSSTTATASKPKDGASWPRHALRGVALHLGQVHCRKAAVGAGRGRQNLNKPRTTALGRTRALVTDRFREAKHATRRLAGQAAFRKSGRPLRVGTRLP